ncbi:MAG: hydrolase [Tissierellia bacterium]|nr:hydrolase [Tissierellia bacterium]
MDKFTLCREESLLLIIDIQERLAPAMKYEDKVIKNTNVLVSTANEMDIPIVVTEQYPKGLGPTVPEINDELNDAQRFEKILFSACTDQVIKALNKEQRKKIIVVGMETHVCVFQTVRDLLELGYEVFVVCDGVSSRFEENHRNGLDLMKDMGAVISNTETILFDLLKKAGTPEFKVLSRLIK